MKNILLALPTELLFEIDEAAKEAYSYRSEYIRRILIQAMDKRESKAADKLRRENPLDIRLLDLDDG